MPAGSHVPRANTLLQQYSIFVVDIDLEQPGVESVIFDRALGKVIYFKVTDPGPTPSQSGGHLDVISMKKEANGDYIYEDTYTDLLNRKYTFKRGGVEIDVKDTRLRAVTDEEQKNLSKLSATIATCKSCLYIEHQETIAANRTFWAEPGYYQDHTPPRP